MKWIQYSLSLICLFWVLGVSAQEPDFKDYDWETDPKYTKSEVQDGEHAIILKEKRVNEFTFVGNGFTEYRLVHRVIQIVSDEGVESYNRVFVPTGYGSQVIMQKARVINQNGKILELDENDIKEATDEERGSVYRYFAMEGAEKGSIVEYLYFIQHRPDYKGEREQLQSEIRKEDVSFELIAPSNLYFKFKSLNDLPEMVLDTTREDKNRWFIDLENMPAQESESSATNYANLQGVLYKLSGNSMNSAFDIGSFGEMSKLYHQTVYTEISKSTTKKLKALIKESGAESGSTQEEKIRKIENHIKGNYISVANGPDQLAEIDGVLENKAGVSTGIVRMYAAIFNLMEIEHQLVLTCDRERLFFDPDFESYNFLEITLFYFPKTNDYLAPSFQYSRYGLVPSEYTAQNGLFIRSLAIGDIVTGIGKVKWIKPAPYDKSLHNIYLTMRFPEGPDEAEIEFENHLGGHMVGSIQAFYNELQEEEKTDLLKGLIGYIFGETEPENVEVENATAEEMGVKPLVLKTTLNSSDFIEKAGTKYLLKVGDLIGQQVEMYEEKERQQPIDDSYNRLFYREITIEVPDGYQISNTDALNMDFAMEEEGERILQFTSSYVMEGKTLKITIDEYYKKMQLPVEAFESYQKVVNAAADFNKITLFMEPVQ